MRSILLQLHVGNPIACEAWSNAPVAHGVQLTVYVQNPGGHAETLARRTHAALERELARLSAYRDRAPCVAKDGRIYPAHTCAGAVSGLASRVLIFIADGTGVIDPTMEQYFSFPGTIIVPLVDTLIAKSAQTVLPRFLKTVLAETTTNLDPGPIIPRILRAAGIVTSSVRLFISYRHRDAATIAGQLFHGLAERGFEPFLDRFSSRPGDDFVDLIREELADKACLLSLETRHIGRSLYCRQEVATAVSRRMGLIAVDLPGSKQTFNVIQKRIDASGASLGSRGELGSNEVARIVAEVEAYYPHEAARRPRWQDVNLHNALMGAGVRFSAQGLGRYVVHAGRGADHILAMSAGLPDTELFIEVEDRRNQLGTNQKAAIFGPLSAARTNRYREIGWLARKSDVAAQDEGRLMRYVKHIR
jgi:hypothetical protein